MSARRFPAVSTAPAMVFLEPKLGSDPAPRLTRLLHSLEYPRQLCVCSRTSSSHDNDAVPRDEVAVPALPAAAARWCRGNEICGCGSSGFRFGRRPHRRRRRPPILIMLTPTWLPDFVGGGECFPLCGGSLLDGPIRAATIELMQLVDAALRTEQCLGHFSNSNTSLPARSEALTVVAKWIALTMLLHVAHPAVDNYAFNNQIYGAASVWRDRAPSSLASMIATPAPAEVYVAVSLPTSVARGSGASATVFAPVSTPALAPSTLGTAASVPQAAVGLQQRFFSRRSRCQRPTSARARYEAPVCLPGRNGRSYARPDPFCSVCPWNRRR